MIAGRSGVSADLRAILERVPAEVEGEWPQLAEDSPSEDEVRGQLRLLLDAIDRSAEGNTKAGDVPRTVLSRRLLELIRRRFVAGVARLDPVPPAAELLEVLTAIERVAHAIEPDWEQDRKSVV